MNKLFKGISGLFGNLLFGVLSLIAGAIIAVFYLFRLSVVPVDYGSLSEGVFGMITEAVCDSSGRYYVLDSSGNDLKSIIYRFDASGNADLVMDNSCLPFSYGYSMDMCIGEDDCIYILAVGSSSLNDEIWPSVILKYDSSGRYVRELVRYNSECSIIAMHEENGILGYILYDGNETAELISVDTSTAQTEKTGEYISDCYYFINGASYYEGEYIISCFDSTLITLDNEGNAECRYVPEFDVYDYTASRQLSYGTAKRNGKYYSTGGFLKNIIFEISDEEAAVIIDTTDSHSISDYPDDENARYRVYEDSEAIGDVYIFNGRLAYSTDETLYVVNDDGSTEAFSSVSLPFINRAKAFGFAAMPFIAAVLMLCGSISVIGCIMHWRFTILSKMLWIMIPVICLMIGMFIKLMTDTIRENYYTNTKNQLVAVSELSTARFDGDELKEMRDFSIICDGRLDELNDTLAEIVSYNSMDWSSNMSATIFLCAEEGYWISPDSLGFAPFSANFSFALSNKSEITYFDNSDTFIKPVYTIGEDEPSELSAITPIYDSDGNTAAMLMISASLETMNNEIAEMQADAAATGIIFMILLTAAEALTAFYIVRNLRKASTVIAGIAGGDFTARVKRTTHDELGEICTGVNNMAGQLETLFSEKDKNEQFYYKFVPEKFRELLHKESFTDLSLGDAESAELTVLFCDIRAFSLNSEMMTAKENFEFVNIIYGIAGPIIRRNGGFVDKYIGDAVMALFESADAAVKAGMELYKEIVLDPNTAASLNMSSINIGIGIHTGMARIGIVGEEERMSGTVISNTVNISSRLESLTKQYNTAMIITKETLDKLSDPDSLELRYLGMVQVAGVNEVKALYEVLDALDEERRSGRAAARMDFREAVKLFHLGKPNESLELFRKLRDESDGTDPALDRYISYIEEKIAANDGDHNVFRFSRK